MCLSVPPARQRASSEKPQEPWIPKQRERERERKTSPAFGFATLSTAPENSVPSRPHVSCMRFRRADRTERTSVFCNRTAMRWRCHESKWLPSGDGPSSTPFNEPQQQENAADDRTTKHDGLVLLGACFPCENKLSDLSVHDSQPGVCVGGRGSEWLPSRRITTQVGGKWESSFAIVYDKKTAPFDSRYATEYYERVKNTNARTTHGGIYRKIP